MSKIYRSIVIINTNKSSAIWQGNLEKNSDGFSITKIHLNTKGNVPGIDKGEFHKIAEKAKKLPGIKSPETGCSYFIRSPANKLVINTEK